MGKLSQKKGGRKKEEINKKAAIFITAHETLSRTSHKIHLRLYHYDRAKSSNGD